MLRKPDPSWGAPRLPADKVFEVNLGQLQRAVDRAEQRAEAAREDLRRFLLSHGEDANINQNNA